MGTVFHFFIFKDLSENQAVLICIVFQKSLEWSGNPQGALYFNVKQFVAVFFLRVSQYCSANKPKPRSGIKNT
ncbi:hypothetical protein AYI77_08310 [Shewanella algae]|nr:hypothetical protein AYI77_08310 [Shewanella algae]PWF93879.1 hypothetical protein DD549_00885 [Shewanella algae]TVL48967.1 hypothetical protein AYJ00_00660 [Shewanella algae]